MKLQHLYQVEGLKYKRSGIYSNVSTLNIDLLLATIFTAVEFVILDKFVVLGIHKYCPTWDVRRGLKVRFRVSIPVLVRVGLVPFPSTLPSFIHATSGTTTSPSTTFTVHTSEYTDPAIELPDDVMITGRESAENVGELVINYTLHTFQNTPP